MSNEYGSLLDTFTALDMYNLPMPVVPPADLTINALDIPLSFLAVRNSASSRVVGFSPDDNPYLRSIGLSSNLADGLVDGSSLHQGSATPSWRLIIRPIRMGLAFPGTATIVLNGVLGVGCLFTQFAAKGMQISWHDANSVLRIATILTVTDDNNLVLTANIATTGMFTGANAGVKVLPHEINFAGAGYSLPIPIMNTQFPFNDFLIASGAVRRPLGKITITAGSAVVNGVGTSFTADFAQAIADGIQPLIGWIDDTGVRKTGAVSSISAINTDTQLNLTTVQPTNCTSVDMLDLDESVRILARFPAAFFAYTISIDPSYGAANRRLSLHVISEIEHTFALNKTVLQ